MTLIRNRYRVMRQLALTTYGGVFLCTDELLHSRRVVLKSISLLHAMDLLDSNKTQMQAADDPRQEKAFATLQRSESSPHPHIVQYLDDFIEGHTLFFVLEFCAGNDLHSRVSRTETRRLDCNDALDVVKQVATALSHLHHNGIAHRDVSLENILLSRGAYKLADFGLATSVDRLYVQRVGKAYYMAPEVVAPDVAYEPKAADVWSLGIVLFVLVTGSPLVQLATKEDARFLAFQKVGVRELLAAWHMTHVVDENAMNLLEGMLQCDPNQRLTIDKVLHHEAFAPRAAAA